MNKAPTIYTLAGFPPATCAAALMSCLLLAGPAQAATDAGQVLRQEQELQKLLPAPAVSPDILPENRPPAPSAPGPRVRVDTFRFSGDVKAEELPQLDRLLSDLRGKELSFDDIRNAADRASAFYRSRGQFLTRVIVPRQEVTGGAVELQVTQGRLDQRQPVRVQGNGLRLGSQRLQDTMKDAMGEDLLIGGLERGILNINDNPGIASTATLEPGDTPGSTRVVLDVTEGPVVSGLVVADNFGSRLIGRNRLAAIVNVNDPLGWGDQLSLSALAAPGHSFGFGRLAYGFPVGTSGIRGGIAYSGLGYHAGSGNGLPETRGKASDLGLTLRYPLVRTGLAGLYLNATFDRKTAYNEQLGLATGDKRENIASAGITAERTDTLLGGGFTQAQLFASAGRLDLSRQPASLAADQGEGGARTHGSFRKANYALSRLQRGTDKLNFQFQFSGQSAGGNLDSMEKFALGGPTGVRAYPTEEGYGDEGYKMSLEARYALASGKQFGEVLLGVFYDRGHVRQYKDPSLVSLATPNSYSLAGWGVSLDVVSAARYSARLVWAHALGSNPAASAGGNNADGRADRSRVWLMLNLNF